MASRPIHSEGASPPSNVIHLPTAAPRKVDNHRYAEQRRAGLAAKAVHAHRFHHQWPGDRRARAEADRVDGVMVGLQRDPSLFLAMGLLKAADAATRAKVAAYAALAVARMPDDPATLQAYEIARLIMGEVGEAL